MGPFQAKLKVCFTGLSKSLRIPIGQWKKAGTAGWKTADQTVQQTPYKVAGRIIKTVKSAGAFELGIEIKEAEVTVA